MTNSDVPNPYDPPSTETDSETDAAPSPPPTHERLVVLATFRHPTDAHLLSVELKRHGIDARVENEQSTALFGATIAGASSAFWIEVIVLESDATQALEVKEQWLESKETQAAEETELPEWKCGCGETVDAGFEVCWSCG
ncbi:MAG: DUF2007 domain-containing protein, partial [Planctomycetota bacterium]